VVFSEKLTSALRTRSGTLETRSGPRVWQTVDGHCQRGSAARFMRYAVAASDGEQRDFLLVNIRVVAPKLESPKHDLYSHTRVTRGCEHVQ
jgi:hypothetical protein